MLDESLERRAGFVEGVWVRLADGSRWALPRESGEGVDPELDGVLREMFETEDRADWLRATLALTIFLLTRNYALTADSVFSLLAFEPGDPAEAVLQETIEGIAEEFRSRRPRDASQRRARTGGYA
ncbi:MAG: hypothetical protein NVSMB9_31500 [Isosphaeraceae bacterium]